MKKKSMNHRLTGLYCMVRASQAGVFAGTLLERDGDEALLINARRIWYWDGAASLSQLATEGTRRPENCKIPAPVEQVLLLGVIEIIPITERARQSLEEVLPWQV